MSDKYEQIAKNIIYKITPNLSVSHTFIPGLSAYLREQFPEPVKIEGVRELAKKVIQINGFGEVHGSDVDEAEGLITDFIQKREAGKWIPVTERLPEKERDYIVFNGAVVFTAPFVLNKERETVCTKTNNGFDWPSTVTHWQPLPPATKE